MTHAVQRGEAQADLSLIRPFVFGTTRRVQGTDGNGIVYMPFWGRRASDGSRTRSVSQACTNGSTFSSTPSGSGIAFTTQIYYDAGCTELWQTINGTQTTDQADQNDGAVHTDATEIVLSTSGVQIEADRAHVDFAYFEGGRTLLVTGTSGPDLSTVRDSFDLFCSSYPMGTTCSPADLQYLATNDADPAVGAVQTLAYGGTAQDLRNTTTYYAGTIAATTLSAMNISGAAFSQAIDAAQTYAFDANNVDRLQSIATTDPINGVNGNVVESATSVTGSLTLAGSGTLIAKYALDINGTGSMQYADGSSEPVIAFAVQK